MLNLRLKIFLFVICFLVFVFLILKLRGRKADVKYVLPWIGLDLGVVVITAFPGILDYFCRLFGIETPSNMLFFFALILLGMVVFSMTLTISRQNEQIRDLTQRLALWEDSQKQTHQREKGSGVSGSGVPGSEVPGSDG